MLKGNICKHRLTAFRVFKKKKLDNAVAGEQGPLYHIKSVERAAVTVSWTPLTHHGQGHDACQVLLRQPDLRLHLLCGAATGRVLHLPGHPAAAQRLWEAFHFQIHLEHSLKAHLESAGEHKRSRVKGVNDAARVRVLGTAVGKGSQMRFLLPRVKFSRRVPFRIWSNLRSEHRAIPSFNPLLFAFVFVWMYLCVCV